MLRSVLVDEVVQLISDEVRDQLVACTALALSCQVDLLPRYGTHDLLQPATLTLAALKYEYYRGFNHVRARIIITAGKDNVTFRSMPQPSLSRCLHDVSRDTVYKDLHHFRIFQQSGNARWQRWQIRI